MSQAINKKVFNTVDKNGNALELATKRPSPKVQTEAQKIYNARWAELVSSKPPTLVRARMPSILKEQGLWTDEQEEELDKLQKQLLETEKRLAAGKGGYPTKDEAIAAALNARKTRFRVYELANQRNCLDSNTAESQAELTRLNYLVSACTVYNNNGDPYFSSLDDYYNRSEETATVDSANNLMTFLFDVDLDFEKSYGENKFLISHGVLNDKLQFVKDGRLYDPDVNLYIDDNGRYVNEAGEYVNRNGDRVDDKGELIIEYIPFD